MEMVREMIDEVPFGTDIESMEIEDRITDMDADACIQKIANWERYRKFWLDYYAKRIEEVNQKCDNNIEYQKRKLNAYYRGVPHRTTKTMEAYDLPSGRISVSIPKQKLVPNKDSILTRLKLNGEEEFIKVKEELNWDEYKSRLFISDSGDVLDKETGEIIKDVSVEMTEAKFSVTINKKGVNEDGE